MNGRMLTMRRFRASIPLSLALIIFIAGSPAGPALAAPKLTSDLTIYDFGTLDETQTAEHTFVLRNEGDQPLTIARVDVSCGCTTTQVQGSTIPPGGSTTLNAKINLMGRRGRQDKNIFIHSNDPAQPQYTLKMSGTVITEVDIVPPRLDFLDMKENQSVQREVRITNTTAKPMKILKMDATGSAFTARLVPLDEGKTWRVAVETAPPLGGGLNRGTITLQTDNPKYPYLTIPVAVQVASDVIVVPNVIVLPYVPAEKPKPATVYLAVRSRTGKDFKITRVDTPSPEVTVKTEALAPGSYKLEVGNILPTQAIHGRFVRIFTDSPTGREVNIPVQVYRQSPAQPPRK
jgi:hypothetical protein